MCDWREVVSETISRMNRTTHIVDLITFVMRKVRGFNFLRARRTISVTVRIRQTDSIVNQIGTVWCSTTFSALLSTSESPILINHLTIARVVHVMREIPSCDCDDSDQEKLESQLQCPEGDQNGLAPWRVGMI